MRPAEIRLVEDNPADVRLAREALREAKVANKLMVVGDGVEAMAYLRREGRHAGPPVGGRPSLRLHRRPPSVYSPPWPLAGLPWRDGHRPDYLPPTESPQASC